MNRLYKMILASEARVGGKIFGPVQGGKREFYCLDQNTWVLRQGGITVFYRVNPAGIYKSNDRASWRHAGKDESKRLFEAAKIYENLVEAKIYRSLLALR